MALDEIADDDEGEIKAINENYLYEHQLKDCKIKKVRE